MDFHKVLSQAHLDGQGLGDFIPANRWVTRYSTSRTNALSPGQLLHLGLFPVDPLTSGFSDLSQFPPCAPPPLMPISTSSFLLCRFPTCSTSSLSVSLLIPRASHPQGHLCYSTESHVKFPHYPDSRGLIICKSFINLERRETFLLCVPKLSKLVL